MLSLKLGNDNNLTRYILMLGKIKLKVINRFDDIN